MRRLGARAWRLPVAVAVVESARLLWVLRRSDGQLVNDMWDDAFYYLVMGRNFARMGRWTFDGVEPASGFHLLWGYLVAVVYWVAPGIDLHGMVLVLGVIQTGLLAGAAAVAVRTAVRLFGEGAELGVAVVFLSSLSLVMGVSGMETALVMLCAAVVLDLLGRTELLGTGPLGSGWVALGLGWVGMLARSDFGLLALVLLGVQGVLWRLGVSRRGMVRRAGVVLAGCVAGLVTVMLHTHWVSGGWVQASARQKLFWARVVGYSTKPVWRLLLTYLDPSYYHAWGHGRGWVWTPRVLAMGVVGMLAVAWWRQGRVGRGLAAGFLAVVLGYVWLYRFDSDAVQDWYIGSFQVPLALLLGMVGAWAYRGSRRWALGVGVLVCGVGIGLSFRPELAVESGLYRAGVYVRVHPELGPVGSWNAGIIGYFAGGGVVNLDGLVNDRVYPYAVSGRLLEYVRVRGVRTVVDYDLMVEPGVMARVGSPRLAERGGYGDGRLRGCLEGVRGLGEGVDDARVWRVGCR